jgi:hypothetical protein
VTTSILTRLKAWTFPALSAALALGVLPAGTAGAATAFFPHCVSGGVDGTFPQTASFPGIDAVEWIVGAKVVVQHDCLGGARGDVVDTAYWNPKGNTTTTAVGVQSVQYRIAGHSTWVDIPKRQPDARLPHPCIDSGCQYEAQPSLPHQRIQQVRQTTYIVHDGIRSRPVTFTCTLDTLYVKHKCTTG